MFANEVLVCFLFPINIGLHRAYHIFTTVIHNGAHFLAGGREGGRDGDGACVCGASRALGAKR